MTTTPRRQQQQTNKGFMNTEGYPLHVLFHIGLPFQSVVQYITLLVVKSVALLKSPLTKQIKTCKVFPAPCEEQRYTMVDSLFLF